MVAVAYQGRGGKMSWRIYATLKLLSLEVDSSRSMISEVDVELHNA